jgi:hypothetical protein
MQQRAWWPKSLVVAKAYIDQLERSNALPAAEITSMRTAIQTAESSKSTGKLKSLASGLEKKAATAKNAADSTRMKELAAILKKPTV